MRLNMDFPKAGRATFRWTSMPMQQAGGYPFRTMARADEVKTGKPGISASGRASSKRSPGSSMPELRLPMRRPAQQYRSFIETKTPYSCAGLGFLTELFNAFVRFAIRMKLHLQHLLRASSPSERTR